MQHCFLPTVSGVGAARGAVRDAGDGEERGMKEKVPGWLPALCSPLKQKQQQFGIFPPS